MLALSFLKSSCANAECWWIERSLMMAAWLGETRDGTMVKSLLAIILVKILYEKFKRLMGEEIREGDVVVVFGDSS